MSAADLRRLRQALVCCCLLLLPGLAVAQSACPLQLDDEPASMPAWPADERPDWLHLYLACLPPLQHARGDRYPLIFWRDAGYRQLARADALALLRRGLVQHLPLQRAAIGTALMFQDAGIPVMIMQGNARWPYDLLPDQHWKLSVDDPERFSSLAYPQANPTRLDAFALGAAQVRDTLLAFRDAGVKVTAVWLDYEGQPLLLDYATVKANPKLAAQLPAKVMRSAADFAVYRRQLWLSLMSAYLAAPIREVYPDASSTNWVITLSSKRVPVLSWDNWHHPPSAKTLFSATNPIAYGIDQAYRALAPEYLKSHDQAAVDRLYMHVLLRQVSADAWNRKQSAFWLQAIPWVARVVQDGKRPVPHMSRQRYREALRHLWLRGIAGMQVFNPSDSANSVWRALAEAQDTQAVYNQMLAFPDLLDHGQVMNYQVPMPDQQGILWSGLRTPTKALVRVTRLGGKQQFLTLKAWPGESVSLAAPTDGASYLLRRTPQGIRVKQLGEGDQGL